VNPAKVIREKTIKLTDLPNVGTTIADDLRTIGINTPEELVGKDAFVLYRTLCEATGTQHDPCMLDVLMSIVDFMNGGEPQVWWAYTGERKRLTQGGEE
jgi:hypothetical protein